MYNLGERFKVDYKSSTSNPESVFKGNKYRITILTDRLIRLEYNENGVFEDRPSIFAQNRNFAKPDFNVSENNNTLKIITKYFELEYKKEKKFDGGKLSPTSNLKILLYNTDKVWYYNHPEARRYPATISMSDNKMKSKKGIFSLDGFISIDDSNTDIILENGQIEKRNSSGIDMYVFMYNKDYYYCLNDYFMLTGKPSFLPRYSFGVWYSKNEFFDENKIQKVSNKFIENNVPISILILNKWSTKMDLSESYSNFKDIFQLLFNRNIRLGLTIDYTDGFDSNQYAKLGQYLQKDKFGRIPFNIYDSKTIDAYLKILIHPLIFNGVDFLSLNKPLKSSNNLNYNLDYYLYNDQKIIENKRPLFCSSNYSNISHRYGTTYSGVSKVGWNALKNIVEFNTSSFNIGMSYWVHDIGGTFDGIEDNELFTRFVQLGVFSPIIKLSSEGGKYYKREPWVWGIKTSKITTDYLNLRYRLIPYIYTEAYKYYKFGKPMIEPIYYRYPKIYDDALYRDEYFFGSQFLISPITEKKDYIMNRVIHKLYIPDGIWYDYFTGKKYRGNKRYTSFYRDEDYPVFVKSGSIIPLNVNKYNNTNLPNELEILIFPGENNTYSIYEDDGITMGYEKGNYIITNVELLSKKNSYNLTILPVEGKVGILPKTRNYKIRFRNTRAASRILSYVQGQEVENKSYRDDKDLVIEVKDVPTNKQFTLMCSGEDIEYDALKIINEDISSIISDLPIKTTMKDKVDYIMFSKELDIKKKRIAIRKLANGKERLERKYIDLFIKLLEYVAEV